MKAGSFIRPTAKGLQLGRPFSEAIKSKYVDEEAETEKGSSQFYSTASNFRIEVTSLSRVSSKFRQLANLREAGLEGEGVHSLGGAVKGLESESEHDGEAEQVLMCLRWGG